jgi:hypothetical protein
VDTLSTANRFVALCRRGYFAAARAELFAANAAGPQSDTSVATPKDVAGTLRRVPCDWSEIEMIHALRIGEPFVSRSYFGVAWMLDATLREAGRTTWEEIRVYRVQSGKIASEQVLHMNVVHRAELPDVVL